MNHSCDPNIITRFVWPNNNLFCTYFIFFTIVSYFIIFSFCQNTLIVRAGQQIKKGEEVFNCYGDKNFIFTYVGSNGFSAKKMGKTWKNGIFSEFVDFGAKKASI